MDQCVAHSEFLKKYQYLSQSSDEYVINEKTFKDNKPITTYKITKQGKQAFLDYVTELKRIVNFTSTNSN